MVSRERVSRSHRLRLSLELPPRDEPLQMVRWILLVFSLASAAALVVLLVGQAVQGRTLATAAVAIPPLLCVLWLDEHHRQGRNLAWYLAESAAVLLVAVATGNPLTVLLLLYVRLAARSLAESTERLVILTTLSIAALIGALLVLSLTGRSSESAVVVIFLASGFLVVAPIMHMLGVTLTRLARGIAREAVLRAALEHLAPALSDEALPQAAVDAVRTLVAGNTAHVALAVGSVDALHIAAISSNNAEARADGRAIDLRNLGPGQRAHVLRGNALHLTRQALTSIWPAEQGRPPEALFLVPLTVDLAFVGLMLIAGPAVPEEDRLAVTTLVAHIALRLSAATLSRELDRWRADQLIESESNFGRLFEVNPLPMWLYDAATLRFIAVNEAALRLYGYSRADFLAMRLSDLSASPARRGRRGETERRRRDSRTETQHRLHGGRVIDVEVDSSRVTFRGRDAVLMLARDVTAERELHRRLEHQTLHDSLTGLANRRLLDAEVARATARAAALSGGLGPAMIALDLDGFKAINDSLGHAFGDRVIAAVAERLANSVRPSDTAARIAGDEFAVLLDETGGPEEAMEVAQRLVAAIEQPLVFGEQSVRVSASAGVAVPVGGQHPDELLRDADIAMYVAKAKGNGSCALFEPEHRAALVDRLALQAELAAALEKQQLAVHYQPQLEMATGRVVAVEALVRWQHPTRGWVPPDVFIPIAEQMGLVPAIDAWVLATAATQLHRWDEEGLPRMRLAVNLSSSDLERADLVATARRTLVESRIDAWRLEFELTESVAVSQPEAAVARLAELRAMGARVAIDDFGTGYSMFSRLRDLPVDRLKIDRSFVTDIATDDDARAIVASTIGMGHALGLDLVAEGVETAESYALLREMGCDTAQGYHLSRPLPADQLSAWVRDRSGERPSIQIVAS